MCGSSPLSTIWESVGKGLGVCGGKMICGFADVKKMCGFADLEVGGEDDLRITGFADRAVHRAESRWESRWGSRCAGGRIN